MEKQKIKSVLREWIESILIALVLALFVRAFIIQAFKIPTGSMRPTLLEGDIILVNKFIYGARVPFTKLRLPKVREPKRGDVIVFIYPDNPKKDYIKRLIGLPGDIVEIKNGSIYINGNLLVEPLFSQRYYYNRGDFGKEGEKIKVPQNCFFVLGDNSISSQDSRYWGFVPRENILGKALVIYWPFIRIRLIK